MAIKANKKEDSVDNRDAKIEAIKEIIFGENIKEIENEFQQTKQHIQEQRETLEAQVNNLRKELDKNLQQLAQDIQQQISKLQEEVTTKLDKVKTDSADRVALGKLLEDVGKKLQS